MVHFLDGVQLPQDYSHFEEVVYFLLLSSQKFLVLILSGNKLPYFSFFLQHISQGIKNVKKALK